MRLLAAVYSPDAVQAILECLGLPARAPPTTAALPDDLDLDSGFEAGADRQTDTDFDFGA